MRWLVAAALRIALASCQTGHEADADPVEFGLGHEFSLNGGQGAVITDENLHLRFTELLEDSRYPTEVECFWTGQARMAVLVYPAESPSTTVQFNTNPAPGQNAQAPRVADYTIELKSLDPYPRTPDDPIAFDDYRATMLVRD